MFTSFNREHLERLGAIDAGFRLGWLVQEIDLEVVHLAREMGLFQLCRELGALMPRP